MKIEIKHRWSGRTLHEGEYDCLATALLAAIAARANLTYANLTGANLTGANLRDANLTGANLTGANLTYANLTYANLTGANLTGANLTYADLTGANLTYANLTYANLTYADLTGANLTYANLTYANLTGANLTYANLTGVRDDIWKVLEAAPLESGTLREALVAGEVDGSRYEGECACLVGTIAKSRGCHYTDLVGLVPNGARPAERWFLAIRPGMPVTHPVVALTLEWVDEWLAAHTVEA